MQDVIVLDLDDTVSDCGHRIHHIKDGNRNWNAFFAGIPDDPIIPHTVALINAWWVAGNHVVVLTGRPESYRPTTEAWIAANLPFVPKKVYMRAENDYRPGPVAKVAALDQMRADGFNPIMAFDDHGGIVKAFRDTGLPTYHVTDKEDDIPKHVWKGEEYLAMMVGPCCAGKSTLVEQFPASWVISSDEVRELMTPWRRVDPNNAETWAAIPNIEHGRVWRAIHEMIKTRLNSGLPTIMDATNIKAADRKNVLTNVPAGQRIRYLVVDRPLDDKIRDRGWRPEALVRRMHESFNSGIKHALNGDGHNNVTVVDLRAKSVQDRADYAKDLAQQWLSKSSRAHHT